MRRLHRSEEGSALILALFFLMLVALFVLPMVTFLDVAQQSSTSLRAQRDLALATDAAIDAAVNRFRSGGSCEDYLAPRRVVGAQPVPLANTELVVSCEQEATSSGARALKPEYGLLSLAGDGEDGVVATAGSVRVRGDVFSNSTVLGTGSASLLVEGTVSAVGNCAQVVTVPDSPLRCANGAGGPADPVRGRDPDYDKRMTTVPPPGLLTTGPSRDPVTGCASLVSSDWLVDVWPGYYDDATVFNALTDGAGCPGRVLWLHPGDYLFNFGYRPTTAAKWTVNDPTVNVVGGSDRGSWSASATRPNAALLPVPGGCRAEDDPAPGVQVVLGGSSQIAVQRGKVELCATPADDDQRIALYGLPANRPVHTLKPTTVSDDGGFANTSSAALIGEASPPASATLDATRTSASLRVEGFRRFVPADAVIDAAVLRVVHREVGDVSEVKVVLPADSECGGEHPLPLIPTGGESIVDLKAACGLTVGAPFLARSCAPTNVACLDVSYVADLATGGASGMAELDGMWIDVAYREPITRKPSTTVPAPTDAVFADAANAFQISEQPDVRTANANLTTARPTASIRLGGYGEPLVQPGSTLDHAVLRIAHADEGAVKPVDGVRVTLPAACGTRNLTISAERRVDRIDLKACGLTPADLNDFAVTYTTELATGGTAATARLDGIWLDLVTGPAPARAPTAADNGAGGFTNAENALALDGAVASATLDSAAVPPVTTAAVTLATFGAALPPGSVVESATLQVRHREDAGVAPGVTVRASRDGGATFCLPDTPVPSSRGALTTATVEILAACSTPTPLDPSQLSVTFVVAVGPGGTTATAALDGIVLDLRYRPSATRRPAATDAGGGGFTVDPANARAIDGATARALLDAAAVPPRTTASVPLTDYGLAVPTGARIEYARLRIVHQEQGDVAPAVSVKASTDGGTTFCLPDTPLQASPGAPTIATVDLLAAPSTCSLADLALLTVTYTVALGAGGATAEAALDGIELDLLVRPAAFDPAVGLAGCGTKAPYVSTDLTTCALVSVAPGDPGNPTQLALAGTVYLPTAALDVTLRDVRAQVITRGVVARTIRFGAASAPAFRRPVVGVPPEAVVFAASTARTLRPATATDIGGFATTPEDGRVIDNTAAEAALTGADPAPGAELRLSGFGQPSESYAADSYLRVRHFDAEQVARVELTVTFADTSTTTFSSTASPCVLCLSGGAWIEDHLPLTGVPPAQLVGATAAYKAIPTTTAPAGTVARLDGVELVEVLSAPRIRARVEFDPSVTRVVGWSTRR